MSIDQPKEMAFIFIALTIALTTVEGCEDSGPLGMITGAIQDWQVTASSDYPDDIDPKCHSKYARIYQPAGYAWCSYFKSASDWLQIDLGVEANVTGFMIQGRGGKKNQWVTYFKVSTALDKDRWTYISDSSGYGRQKIFEGNTNANDVKHYYLDKSILARYVRFHPVQWRNRPAMRVEILGCQKCRKLIAVPPYGKYESTTFAKFRRGSSCLPEMAHLYSNQAWCSKRNNQKQWIQVDVGPATQVTGIVTKGRGDTKKKQWVTSYKLEYYNSWSKNWTYYKRPGESWDHIFQGNDDKYTEKYHYFERPFTARFIRIRPVSWHSHISLRFGLLGCPYTGTCAKEFFKFNDDLPCVENIAFRQPAYISPPALMASSKKHRKRALSGASRGRRNFGSKLLTVPRGDMTQAGKAVDGLADAQLRQCTILSTSSNLGGRRRGMIGPVWVVDLGHTRPVSGAFILTGEENGALDAKAHTASINIANLTVYVDNKGNWRNVLRHPERECQTVSNIQSALFQTRIHFSCNHKMRGRYVYVTPWPSPLKTENFFQQTLCEVMVYE